MQPSISIIIPTYQRPQKLLTAVRSALAGCPDDSEVLVVDDQSDTAHIALSDMSADSRLRIMDNKGVKGAAGARNFGVERALSEIILFLDDDDELIADYPQRVLIAARQDDISFGFANVNIVDHTSPPPTIALSRRSRHLEQGPIAMTVPLEHKVVATGCGFWIRKDVFAKLGGISTDQIVDEDTDLSCRLYGHGYRGWFDARPAVLVHQGYETSDGTSPHLSTATNARVVAECYARTFERNQHLFEKQKNDRWFLYRRALRYCAKNDVAEVALALIRNGKPWMFRIRGWLFWQLKRTGQILSG